MHQNIVLGLDKYNRSAVHYASFSKGVFCYNSVKAMIDPKSLEGRNDVSYQEFETLWNDL